MPAVQRSQRVVSTPPGEQRGPAAQEQRGTPASAGPGGRTPERSPYTRSPYAATGSPVVTTPEQLRKYMVRLLATTEAVCPSVRHAGSH